MKTLFIKVTIDDPDNKQDYREWVDHTLEEYIANSIEDCSLDLTEIEISNEPIE